MAQKATLLTYSDKNLDKFLDEKSVEKGSIQFPFHKVEEFLLCYIDDLCLFTPREVDNAVTLHLFLVEFIFIAR